jgi:hypothetical protein
MRPIGKCSVVLAVVAGVAVAPAGALAASLNVSPARVTAGDKTRVFGSVGSGCAVGNTVTLLSRAFPRTHTFAGVPAVSTPVRANHRYSVKVRIPATRAPGSYQVSGRCGGGNLGVSRRLRVVARRITAFRTSIASHPAYVRAVIRFRGGRLGANDAEAADPDPFNGLSRMVVSHAGIRTTVPEVHGLGVSVRVIRGSGRLRVRLATANGRFKYLAYRQVHAPERLIVDLYRSRPPVAGAQMPGMPNSCLSIANHADTGGTIQASGTANGIFENQFTLAVRDAAGKVVGHRNVAFGMTGPNWSSTVSYAVSTNQPGTLEAVDLSARDGALACLAQIRVPLAAPLPPPMP